MKLNEKIYEKIAEKYGVTEDEIKKDMQEAINSAYIKPNSKAAGISRKGDIPDIDEFVEYVIGQIDKK